MRHHSIPTCNVIPTGDRKHIQCSCSKVKPHRHVYISTYVSINLKSAHLFKGNVRSEGLSVVAVDPPCLLLSAEPVTAAVGGWLLVMWLLIPTSPLCCCCFQVLSDIRAATAFFKPNTMDWWLE